MLIAPVEMADILATALAEGQNPRTTARRLRDEFAVPLARARAIARTEQMRAYNRATMERYRTNADVVGGWIWVSAADARSCPACFAMHGSRHRLDETLDGHPGCRCTAIPIVKGMPPLEVVRGEAVLRSLPEAVQRRVLGPGKWQAWQEGELTITPTGARSVVGRVRSRRWGTMRVERSLRAIVGTEDAQRYTQRAIGKVSVATLGAWRPLRADAAMVGSLGDPVWAALGQQTRVRQVYAAPEAWQHIRERHEGQFDIERGQQLLANIVALPNYVLTTSKPNAFRFVGEYDQDHSLIVILKVLPEEIWLETMIIRNNKRLLKDIQKAQVLYANES
jgi:SPP1 gp7 family putative phage head morphogenesis protein